MLSIDLSSPSNAAPFNATPSYASSARSSLEEQEQFALVAQLSPAAAWPGAEAYIDNLLTRLFPGGVQVGAGALAWLGAIAGGVLSSSFGEYLVGVASGRIPPEISARDLQFAGPLVTATGIGQDAFQRLSPEGKIALIKGFAAISQDDALTPQQMREAGNALYARLSGAVIGESGRALPGPAGLTPQEQENLGLTGRPAQPDAASRMPAQEGFPTGGDAWPLVLTNPGAQPDVSSHTGYPRDALRDLAIQRTVFPALTGGPGFEDTPFGDPSRLPQVLSDVEMLARSAKPVATPGASRNIAMLEYDLDGVTGRLPSISGNRTVPGFAPPVPADSAIIPALYNNRQADTEYKLLNWLAENIENHLDGADTSGRIAIYSKFTVCDSCAAVIRQFQELYPRISVTVIHGTEPRMPTNLSDPLPGNPRPN
jgi:hypothetical protein